MKGTIKETTETNVHKGHRERLKQRFLEEGLNSFAPHEILELFLYPYIPQKDTNPIAHALIERFGSLTAVIESNPSDLASIPNMTTNAAIYISLLKQIIPLYLSEKSKLPETIGNRFQALEYFQALIGLDGAEQVYLLCLNSKSKVLKTEHLAEGNISKCNLSIKSIIETSLRHKAFYIILSHNHPSGDCSPSLQDITFTQYLHYTAKMLNITLIDHFIVSRESYFSFSDNNMLQLANATADTSNLLLAENIINTERLK